MFNIFPKKTAKDYIEQSNEVYNMPDKTTTKKPSEDKQEYYRIGARSDGLTTITMLDHAGFSMTLTLNKAGCEQMIRMIRATYAEETPTNDE